MHKHFICMGRVGQRIKRANATVYSYTIHSGLCFHLNFARDADAKIQYDTVT